jgi:hypothetical protein
MKTRALLTIGLALILLGFRIPANRLYLSGKVHFKGDRSNERVEGLSLFVRAAGSIVAETRIESNGQYAISFIPEDQSSFDFYYAGLGRDTTFIKSFTQFESDLMTWDIEL